MAPPWSQEKCPNACDASNVPGGRNLRAADRSAQCASVAAASEGECSLWHAGDEALKRRIRAHGNFIEYAPLAVLVLGLVEYRGGAEWFVWSLAAGFVFSRVTHAIGMLFTATPPFRAVAMLVNHVSFLSAGIWLVS